MYGNVGGTFDPLVQQDQSRDYGQKLGADAVRKEIADALGYIVRDLVNPDERIRNIGIRDAEALWRKCLEEATA